MFVADQHVENQGKNSNKPQASGFDFLRAAADQATKEGAYTAGEARNVLNVIDFLENTERRLREEIEQLKDPTTVPDEELNGTTLEEIRNAKLKEMTNKKAPN